MGHELESSLATAGAPKEQDQNFALAARASSLVAWTEAQAPAYLVPLSQSEHLALLSRSNSALATLEEATKQEANPNPLAEEEGVAHPKTRIDYQVVAAVPPTRTIVIRADLRRAS